jgi:hypothetical protein
MSGSGEEQAPIKSGMGAFKLERACRKKKTSSFLAETC